MPPTRNSVPVINAGIEAICRVHGFDAYDADRLQVCMEGVFMYCVKTLMDQANHEPISVKLFKDGWKIAADIERTGMSGEFDMLLRDPTRPIKRVSFEALGLYIAREMLQTLTSDTPFDIVSGRQITRYKFTYHLGEVSGDDAAEMDREVDELLDFIDSEE